MARRIAISSLCLLLLLVTGLSYGHIRTEKKKKHFINLNQSSLSLYKGVRFLDVAQNGYRNKNRRTTSNGVVVRMPLVKHFKAEVALDYSQILKYPKQDNNSQRFPSTTPALSVPVSIQYYFLPKKCKVQPYLGVGSVLYSDVKNSLSVIDNGEIVLKPWGTKYISLFFTQGIIFELNTKIQLSESLNIINEDGKNSFGLNFGIGFKLP